MEQKSLVDELTDIHGRLSDEVSECEVSCFVDTMLYITVSAYTLPHLLTYSVQLNLKMGQKSSKKL